MAKGRKAMPAKIHKLHGSYREDRHGEEITVKSVLLAPPARLDRDPVAKAAWLDLASELHGLGVLARVDGYLLEDFCVIQSRKIKAWEKMLALSEDPTSREGEVSTTPNGYQQQSAWLQIYNTCVKQQQSLAAEFGLSPATRARMRLVREQPKQLDLLDLLDEVSKVRTSANG